MDIRTQLHRYLLYAAILANDSYLQEDGSGVGDPTEYCLLEMAAKAGLSRAGISEETIRGMMPRMEEIPFDSDRKLMSAKYRLHGVPTVLTKGAVDVLLGRVTQIAEADGVRALPRTTAKRFWSRTSSSPETVCESWHLPVKKWERTMCFPWRMKRIIHSWV